MSNSNTKAIRADVPLGDILIEGYLLPENLWTSTNKFGVSKTQAVLLAYPHCERSQASKRFVEIISSKKAQRIAPEGLKIHKGILTNGIKGETVKVDLVQADQVLVFLTICKELGSEESSQVLNEIFLGSKYERIKIKNSKKSNTELQYQLALQKKEGGEIEVMTEAGKIDLLTSTELIEVKKAEKWKEGIGQLTVYGYYYPSHQKRLHLFGKHHSSFLDIVKKHCNNVQIRLTWE